MSILKKNTQHKQRRRGGGGEGGGNSRLRRARSSASSQGDGQQQHHHHDNERHVKFPTTSSNGDGDDDQVLTNVVSILEPLAEGERAILWYTVSFWIAFAHPSAPFLPLQIGFLNNEFSVCDFLSIPPATRTQRTTCQFVPR